MKFALLFFRLQASNLFYLFLDNLKQSAYCALIKQVHSFKIQND